MHDTLHAEPAKRARIGNARRRETRTGAPRIGIVGAGQLGLLLCDAARRLGLETVVASPDAGAPALGAATETVVGAFDDPVVAAALIEHSDVVTFEIEDVPAVLLDRLETAERQGRIRVRPGVATMRTLQNKARQKNWMAANGVPTLPYRVLPDDALSPAKSTAGFPLPIVQKTQRGGYDGQGVQVLRAPADLERLWPVPSLIEPCLDERTEVAVVVARGADGECRCFAPVEMTFDERLNVLDTVVSPARLPGAVRREATTIARRTIEALGGVGVFAVEMFVTPDGTLLVNEISPRVHNTGHHTIESCAVSQFEQHLRAVAGLPLGDTRRERPAVMRNLLYTDALAALRGSPPGPLPSRVPGTFIHWYGKRDARPWRKMGHVTCLAGDVRDASRLTDSSLLALTGVRDEAAA